MSSLSILIADDHELFRRSLRFLLESRPDWRICGEAADGREAVDKTKELKPDIVLLDVSMPEMNGLEAARLIHRESPESRILLVSQNDPRLLAQQVTGTGASGYLTKSTVARDLIPAIEKFGLHRAEDDANGFSSESAKRNGNPSPEKTSTSEEDPAAAIPAWLPSGGEMSERMRSLDWSRTPLGPMDQWPQSLKTSVSICLASRFPIVMYWGPEYVVLYNDAYSAILGSKHPWALGQPCRICWAEIWDTIGPMLDSVVRQGQATWSDDLLLLLRRHDYPEECYFSFSFSPIRVETGAVGGVFTAVIETTDGVIGERRLRALRDLAAKEVEAKSEADAWRIAAESLAQDPHDVPFSILCEVGDSGRPVRILGTAGIDAGHPICQSLLDPASKLSEELQQISHSREDFQWKDLTAPSPLPPGAWETAPHSAVALPLLGAVGSAPAILIAAVSPHKRLDASYRTFLQLLAAQIANSVSDARSYDEQRRRAEALAELDRAKTAFFSNISHEFRTPLTLMMAPLEEALAEAEKSSASNRERLELAHRNSLRLLKLVNTLLDFSRIEAGRVEAVFEPVDLAVLTSELASVFQSAIERAGLRLQLDCAPLSEPVYVDPEMWEKIVLNLLSNAFKFTFEGEIRVSLRSFGSSVELSVSDTGTGIPADEIPRIFERFHRVKNARGRSYEGSGIGLALVQELAKLHGGSVRVESQVDVGSTFTVAVPLGKEHLPADRIGVPRNQASTALRNETFLEEALRWLPEPESGPQDDTTALPSAELTPGVAAKQDGRGLPRVLLADDNADMRQYIRRLLSKRYEVITVSDGEAALSRARERRPDLILSDVMMPRMDGFALLHAIRRDTLLRNVPVILLSARAGEESRIEGLEAGADDYLIKPFSARELLARVKSQIEMAHSREAAVALQRKLLAQTELERERLHELFMQVPAAICLLSGPEHRYVFVNHEYLHVTGRRQAEDFLGKTVREALPELNGQPFFDLLDNVYRTGVPHIGTEEKVVLNRAPGGPQEVYHNFTYQAVRGSVGEVEGILGHVVDVTEQVQARRENANRDRATTLLAAIVDSSDDAIISKNLDGVITSWNKGAERLFGYTANEAIGKHITLIIPPERHGEEKEILARLRRGERIDHFETVRMRRDGALLDISLTISPVRDSHGKVVGASKVARDITAQKRTEKSLRESEQRLRELAETLELEVRGRTLELEERNADVLRQSEQLRDLSRCLLQAQDEERRRIARELHDSAGQTLTVLGMSLARLAQHAQGKPAQVSQNVQEAEKLVQELHQEIRTMSYLLHPPLLDETGLGPALSWYLDGLRSRSDLKMTLSIPEDFDRLPRDMELVIFRLVQESLTNIHRHSGSKTAAIRITRDARVVTVEIRDEGKGIPPQKLAEIHSRGSGVGIRGMRERVRQFKGEMLVESNGPGTRILVTLPVPKNKAEREQRPVASLQTAL